MGLEKVVRADYRLAYWARAIELSDLLSVADQEYFVANARKTLTRRQLAALVERTAVSHDVLTRDEVNEISRRYGLWTVRAKHDWRPRYLRRNPLRDRLDESMCRLVPMLDIELRREVEDLLRALEPVPTRACDLRVRVERCGSALATDLDWVVAGGPPFVDYWKEFGAEFTGMYSQLERLLTLAGSPSFDEPSGDTS